MLNIKVGIAEKIYTETETYRYGKLQKVRHMSEFSRNNFAVWIKVYGESRSDCEVIMQSLISHLKCSDDCENREDRYCRGKGVCTEKYLGHPAEYNAEDRSITEYITFPRYLEDGRKMKREDVLGYVRHYARLMRMFFRMFMNDSVDPHTYFEQFLPEWQEEDAKYREMKYIFGCNHSF